MTSAGAAALAPPLAAERPRLLLGLGNPLMGDDGVAWVLTRRLRADPRLPPDVEVGWGGTDLLARAEVLAGRRSIVLLDAAVGEPAGELRELDPWAAELTAPAGVHAPSLGAALRLLRLVDPGLATAEVRLLVVTVERAVAGGTLSAALEARLPALAREVLAALGAGAGAS